jgi:DNA-directed RNA polymerase specialized sigma24 family protein
MDASCGLPMVHFPAHRPATSPTALVVRDFTLGPSRSPTVRAPAPEELASANDAAEYERLLAVDRHSPEAEVLACDLVRVVTVELTRMSEKERVAFVLLKEEGLSINEAAAILGTTPAVVRQRTHRAYITTQNRAERSRIAAGRRISREVVSVQG